MLSSPLRHKYFNYLREQNIRVVVGEIDEDDIMDWEEYQDGYEDRIEEENRDSLFFKDLI